MADLERIPVIVGVGRKTYKQVSSDSVQSPMDMLVEVSKMAADDLHIQDTAGFLGKVDLAAVVGLGPLGVPKAWGGDQVYREIYVNPPMSLGSRLGATIPASNCLHAQTSGNMPQLTVSSVAEMISQGECRAGVVAGCEFIAMLKQVAQKDKSILDKWAAEEKSTVNQIKQSTGRSELPKPFQPGDARLHKVFGHLRRTEFVHGLSTPVNVYPIFEQDLRVRHKRSVKEHMLEVSKLWSGFSEVAAKYPEHSWFPTARTPEEIMTPDKNNRYVGYPYTKYHCSVIDVNQFAALIMTSVAEAKRWRIPEEQWVYVHGVGDAIEKETLERPELGRSPAMGAAAKQALADANVDVSQISQCDLYSCFPVAVEVGVEEIGLPAEIAADPSKLTVTGGLPFHGGPGANYVMHSIAAMVEHLRAARGTFGLVTANGGYMSKHAAGVYSTVPYTATHPKASAWTRTSFNEVQDRLDAVPSEPVCLTPSGRGLLESYIVAHGRGGSERALCVGRLQDGSLKGQRFVAICEERGQLSAMMDGDLIGEEVFVEHDSKSQRNTFSLASKGKL